MKIFRIYEKIVVYFVCIDDFCSLPPLAESVRELQALLGDARFYDSLGSAEMVKEIIRTETGYLVLTQNYAMRVDIKYGGKNERKLAGPVQFQLEFQTPVKIYTSNSQ